MNERRTIPRTLWRTTTVLATLTTWLACATPVWAQFDSGAVLGTIRDMSGAALPGATVTLRNDETGGSASMVTDASGAFEFFTVRLGTYTVVAELQGFATGQVPRVQVHVGARQRVDVELGIGPVAENITVVGYTPLVETDSSQRGHVVSGDQIREIALNGREYSALALLSPGVRQSALNKSTNTTPREGAFNVNGLRSIFNNFLIDGVDNNAYGTSNQGFSNQVIQPPPDAVSEFRVVTNNQSAEYGRAAGATVNVAYRSGTNSWRGDAWEFFRDTALNATTFFKPVDGTKPPLTRNQFGGTIGGPLMKNRAFFFADYEGFRQTRKSTIFSSVPLASQKNGIMPVDVRDPRTGTIHPAGTPIPMTPFARTVLAGLPDPNLPGTANNYSLLAEATADSDKAGGKVDLRLSPSVSAFGRYGWRDFQSVDQPQLPLPSGGGGNGTIYVRNKQLVLGATWTASPTSLFEARLGWSNTQGGKNPPALGSGSPVDLYGLSGLPGDSRIVGGLPTQSITGITALGRQATNPQWQYPTVWNPKLNYSWLMGRQSLKAGYEFQRVNVEVQDVNPLYGLDTYTGQFTRPAGAAANPVYNISDFMLGLRSQLALSTLFVAQVRQNLHFLYVQDDFRLTDRLTLNAGLRYEYATPMWEANNQLTNFDPVSASMIAARGGSVADRALVDPDRNNFGPRLGMAFTLAPQTVVRGGWGMSYVHVNRIGSANLLAINGPQVIRAVVNNPTDPTSPAFRTTEQGYPADITDRSRFNPAGALVSYIPRDYHSSPVQSWYASVQQEFGPRMLLDVAYVGNKADDLLMLGNFNQADPNNAAGTIPLSSRRRPIPTFGDITYVFNGGKSRYRAFEIKYEWRLSSNVQLLSALTLSTAKDNSAGALENQNGNFPGPQDIRNLDADYGLSGYHQPYNSTTSFVVSLPVGRGRRFGGNMSSALDAIVGGWQLSGLHVFTPGEMVTFTYTPAAAFVVSGIPNDFSGLNNYRPNIICDPVASNPTHVAYFNPACVGVPTDPSRPFGDAPRNSVRGPNFWNVDFAASKNVPVGRGRIQLRVEVFNLFNRVNFAPPDANRSNANFGTITTTYDQRQLQLGAKVMW